MDIAQVAKRTGIAASALRYYEKVGLISSVDRVGARRVFSPAVVDQLALISLGQAAGLSLDEVKSMFTKGGMPRIDRSLLSAKADRIDALRVQLRSMSRALRHAAECPARNHFECPSFQTLLKAAASGSLKAGRKSLEMLQANKTAGRARRQKR